MVEDKFKVLCIDDDQNLLDALRVVIESGGYEMAEAKSARAGIAAFDEHQPDLVMVDLMMESIAAGIDAAAAIRAKAPHTPIYMLTSVGEEMLNQVDPGTIQLNGVLEKPVDPQDLLTLLKRELDGRRV